MRKSALNNQDWYQELEDIPDRVIDVPVLEKDEYVIDLDRFNIDTFSIGADL